MNAHTHITTLAEPTLAHLAASVLAGDMKALPPVEHVLFDESEWRDAAEHVLHGDADDFEVMLSRELTWDRWMRLSDRARDDWCGFENYFASGNRVEPECGL